MESTEMRVHQRVPVCCAADIFHTGANEPEHGFVTDLSEGGAFVQTKRPLRRGDRVFLRVALDTEAVAGVATEVAWVKKFEPICVDGKLPGVGVRFLDLAPPERSRIRLFLKDAQRHDGNPSLLPSTPAIDDGALLNNSDLDVREPKVIWHDTDVDGYDVAATDPPRDEQEFFAGDEPELGDPVVDDALLLSVPPRRVQRSPTLYFALGSLSLGIIAGALYGALAPAAPTTAATRRAAQPASTATRIDLTAATAAPIAAALPETETSAPAPGTTGPTLGDDDEIPGVTAREPTVEPTSEVAAAAAAEPTATEGAPLAIAEATPPLEPIVATKPEAVVATPEPATKSQPVATTPEPAAKSEPTAVAMATQSARPVSAVTPSSTQGAISVSKPKQLSHGWQIAIRGGAVATKKFALTSPARAVIDVPAARTTGLEARELGAGPFERVRLGKQGDQVRLVLDLRGVVTPSQIKFSEKGSDLVIEIPTQALAHR